MTEETKITNESSQTNSGNSFLVLIVIIGFIVNIGFSYWMVNQQKTTLDTLSSQLATVSNAEVLRAGGQENYKKLEKIYGSSAYKSQQAQSLDAALTQFGIAADESGNTNTGSNQQTAPSNPTSEKSGTLTQDEIKDIMKDAYVRGSKDATVTILEFADLECPYCKRFEEQGTIESVLSKYEGKVNSTFKHFPLSFHQYAMTGAKILECVGQISKGDKYYSFLSASAKTSETNDETLMSAAKDQGIDEKKLNDCLAKSDFTAKINAEQTLGQSKFGISGTPASVIINDKTGEWELISGAVPASSLETVIDKFLQK